MEIFYAIYVSGRHTLKKIYSQTHHNISPPCLILWNYYILGIKKIENTKKHQQNNKTKDKNIFSTVNGKNRRKNDFLHFPTRLTANQHRQSSTDTCFLYGRISNNSYSGPLDHALPPCKGPVSIFQFR